MSKKTSNISSYNKTLFSLASDATVKISLWKTISEPFKLLCINWQIFLILAVPVAAILTISSFGFGRTTLCSLKNELSTISNNCSDDPINFYSNILIYFSFLLLFAVKWSQFALKRQPASLKNITALNRGQIKAMGWICFFMLINLSPLIALAILFLRIPNPIWQQELIFFTSVAWIFLLPLLAIRFYTLIAFALDGEKAPTLKQIWNQTAGNMLKLLLGTSVIIFIALYVFMHYYNFIQTINESPTSFYNLIITLATDFEYNILTILFTVLCINYCQTQKELFFNGAKK